MKKFEFNKTYEGAEAAAFIKDLKFRPDLNTAVVSGTYYETDEGKIIQPYILLDYHPQYGLSKEAFPRFCVNGIHNCYESEVAFWAKMEAIRQSMREQGRVPRPLRNTIGNGKSRYLSGWEATRFLKDHQDLGIDPWHFELTGSAHSFKDHKGRIIEAGVWYEKEEMSKEFREYAPFKEGAGPWICTGLMYASEESAKEWRAYLLDQVNDDTRNHLLYPYLLNKPNWPAEIPKWQGFLAGSLEIPIAQLDFSLASCELLEAQREKLKISREQYLKDFFAPCLGYLCEVVRRYKNGTWEMRPAPAAPTVFEPFIKLDGGRLMHFFVEYWDWVYEDYENFTLSGMASFAAEDL